mmetsp:Transcript_86983/g.151382  ORF Transcript_86983/g.151382 Transcript_86983/m.151382 type:complete len:109 (+) Transcript_86983:391-717(+)
MLLATHLCVDQHPDIRHVTCTGFGPVTRLSGWCFSHRVWWLACITAPDKSPPDKDVQAHYTKPPRSSMAFARGVRRHYARNQSPTWYRQLCDQFFSWAAATHHPGQHC